MMTKIYFLYSLDRKFGQWENIGRAVLQQETVINFSIHTRIKFSNTKSTFIVKILLYF